MSNSIYFNTLKQYENQIALNEFGRGKDKKKRKAKAAMGRKAAEGGAIAAGVGGTYAGAKYGAGVIKRSGAKALPTSALTVAGKKGMNIPGGNSAAAQRVKAAANIIGNDAKNTAKKGAYQAGMLAGKGTGAAKNTGSKVAGFLGKAARKLLRK